MKIEKLEISNKKFKLGIVIGVIITATVFILINYLVSRASYRNTQSIPLMSGTITYKIPDLNVIAMYKDGIETDTMPGPGYEIDQENSYCYTTDPKVHDDVTLATDSNGNLVIGNLKKGSKCHIYFVKGPQILTQLIDINNAKTNPTLSTTACDSGCGTTESGIYKAQDDYGTSYYYRGTVNNNWVKFGGYWWRIIRINGNGTVRMIYSGTVGSGDQPAADGYLTPSDNSQLSSTSKYNSTSGDNTYVGWRTGTVGANNYTAAHSNSKNSTILDAIIKWYNTDSTLSSTDKLKIDGATGFCNDRTPYDKDAKDATLNKDSYGFGTKQTYYGADIRTRNDPREASLECPQASQDLFTTEGNKGNGVGQVPVGLITVDEVALAGGMAGSSSSNYNKRYWLYTNKNYWTMSPYYVLASGTARVFYVLWSGSLYGDLYVNHTALGVRPVINLKSTTKFSGSGIVSDPYIPS